MNDMDTTKELIKEIWELWESMAECGELHIGPQFSANYKRLKAQVEQKLNLSGIIGKRPTPILDKQAITEFVNTEVCDYDDESGRYFREDTVIGLFETYLSAACASGGDGKGVSMNANGTSIGRVLKSY